MTKQPEAEALVPGRVLLFVYGSLKSNCENAHLMAGATLLGAARTKAGYRLIRYCDGFPGLEPILHSDESVAGELYAVEPAHLAELDVFEECPTLYQRLPIGLDDGRIAQAYLVPTGSESMGATLERY